jgi:hypothetical protein
MYNQMVDDRDKRNKLSPEESILCMNEMMAGYYHLECMDAVRDTTLYNQRVKERGNAFMKVLEPHVSKGIEMLWGVEDTAFYNLLDHQKSLLQQIAKIKPEQRALLNEIMKQFMNAPELTAHRLGIKIVDDGK